MGNSNKKLDKNNIENILSLSPMQEGILYYYLLNKKSDYYLEQLQIKVTGKIDPVIFEKSWNIVAKTNEMLRTVFRWENLSNPIQVVLKSQKVKVSIHDISKCEDVEIAVNAIIEKDRKNMFDLTEVPFRVTLCKLDDTSYMILVTNHHILYDGWSNGIILKEFFETYNALVTQKAVVIPNKTKYREYIKWIGSNDKNAQREYWKRYLSDYKPKLILERSSPEDAVSESNISCFMIDIPKDLVDSARNFAKSNDITLAALLYSAWGIVLLHYCNENDVVFGTTVSVRPENISGISSVVGLCINTIPLRVKADGNEIVLDFLKKINKSLQERKEYEAAPLTDIMACNGISRDEKLFQSIFVIENYPISSDIFDQNNVLKVEAFSHYGRSSFDITVIAKTFDKNINLEVQYNNLIFDAFIAERMAKHFEVVLEEIIIKHKNKLCSLNILSHNEKDEILFKFNNTECNFEADICIHEYFEKRVAENPEKIAVIQGTRTITYYELNEKANKLARLISRKKNIMPDTAIGIMVYPSIEMIIGIMAILKAGGAYVPLDPDNPPDRNAFILQDSCASMLLTSSDFAQIEFWDGDTLFVDGELTGESGQNLEKTSSPGNLAYIIYTSGSTGYPKGVMIEHRSVVNILTDLEKRFPVEENDTFLLKTTYTFDVSVTEIMGWFVGRGRLAVLEKGDERDPARIIDAVKTYNVTHMNIVPSMFRYLLEYIYQKTSSIKRLSSLKYIFSAGEALKADLVEKFNSLNTNISLVNLYGPTESTIYATAYSLKDFKGGTIVPIGKPMSNLHAYILDKHNRLQPVGVPGELCLSGAGISRGYVNKEQLTREKFISNPYRKEIEKKSELLFGYSYDKIYKTGDLVRWMPDGNIEYLGRNDFQIKIRGFRIELEEIENKLLSYEKINEAVVIPKTDTEGDLYLCAYYTSSVKIRNEEIINYLSSSLPSYMLPSIYVKIDKMPLTSSGKIDRKSLPEPDNFRPELKVEYTAPQTDVQKEIINVWKDVLQINKIGILDNFFDIGGNSLRLIRVSSKLTELFKTDVPITTLLQYPTVQSLANHLTGKENNKSMEEAKDGLMRSGDKDKKTDGGKNSDIAIIGMACRFPGADNVSEFWDKLRNGTECISFFKDEELINAGVSPELVADTGYVKAQGAMNNPEYFDSDFFRYSPREAEIMDPQVRVFHEVVWEALEDSGYSPYTTRVPIGLFSCASPNLFWESLVVLSGKAKILGELASEQLFNKDYMSTRVSYKLNLTGPSVSIYTACSSSLVAVHIACESLLKNECKIAIAGSSTISPLPDKTGYLYQEGMVKSPDGHCRAFDIDAAGFVGGTGVGVVVLKRLSDAIEDRDNILAVIKASAINNDGSNKVGYTAPSVEGQKNVIQAALTKAGVTPESICYIEAHGTATPLGDSVEIEALKQAFNTDRKNFCGIGSVKTNIGHLDCTAGVAGLIKTVLALKHRLLPPTLNVTVANPKLNLIDSPFYLVTEPTELENEGMPLRAGINSLGLGGTNVHIIVEEAPVIEDDESKRPLNLIILSARTESALNNQIKQLAEFIDKNPAVNMADLTYTLQVGRTYFAYRTALVVENRMEAIKNLNSELARTFCPEGGNTHIVFNFVSKGLKSIVKWIELYKNEDVFKKEIDKCLMAFSQYIEPWFINVVDNGALKHKDFSAIEENIFIAFSVQYALAKTLMSWGIMPNTVNGDGMEEAINMVLSSTAGFEEIKDAVIQKLKQIQHSTGTIGEVIPDTSDDGKNYINVYFGKKPNGVGSFDDKIVQFSIDPSQESSVCRLLLEKLGQLWMLGATVDWDKFHYEERRKRISLPTYPFERKRYWIDGNPFEIMPRQESEDTTKKPDISDWFYVPLWEQSLLKSVSDAGAQEKYSGWMVLTDNTEFHNKLVNELEAKVGVVIRVTKGATFEKLDENNYVIGYRKENDYITLMDTIARTGKLPGNIVSLWGVTVDGCDEELNEENVYRELDLGFFSITYLAKALMKQSSVDKTRLIVVTSCLHNVNGVERSNPAKAAVLGPCKVIPQELPFVRCRNIDISIPKDYQYQNKLVHKLVCEMISSSENTIVAYRNNIRYTQTYVPVKLPKSTAKFKEKGVYLITGGLGNVGFAIAQYLAENYHAKLILIGRTVFPQRGEREKWLMRGEGNAALVSKVRKIIELEKQGAEIYTYSGNISDYNAVSSIVNDAESRTGKINGVIHAAGAMRESLYKTLEEVNREDCLKQFEPKIFGTMVLHRLFKDRELDFFTVTSSTSSVLGGLGFTAYSASNIFMDSFISEFNRISGKEWISINWEGWKFNVDGIQQNFSFLLSELFMEPEEGVEVFERVINSHGFEQVIVSSGNLHNRLNRWVRFSTTKKNTGIHRKNEIKIDRCGMNTSYVSPENKMEETIAAVLQDYFGYKEISIHDNFFDLGATSLDMIQITGTLRKKLNMNIPVLKLFLFPTIHLLAQNLAGGCEEAATAGESVDRTDELKKGKKSIQLRYNLRKK